MVSMSSREFNQDVGRAKKASLKSAVVITDRGKPSHVLLSYAQYQQLIGQPAITDLLGMEADLEFEVQKADLRLKPVDLD